MKARSVISVAVLLLAAIITFHSIFFDEANRSEQSRWQLPAHLREVSGLAVLDADHVLTMTDELATVYRVNVRTGEVNALFSLGNPIVADDFEGITVAGNDVWLVNSRGELYHARDALAGGDVTFEVISTGLEEICEVEGLTFDAPRLLMVCKTNYRSEDKDNILIFEWMPGATAATLHLALPTDGLTPRKKLEPSGIFTNPNYLYIVAARQSAFLVFSREGDRVSAKELSGHPQAEGIVIMPDGAVLIADEGKGAGGMITRYERVTGID